MIAAGDAEIAAIEARRVDDTARAMMREGLRLTFAQADGIGDAGIAWLAVRLRLTIRATDTGVDCTPRLRLVPGV